MIKVNTVSLKILAMDVSNENNKIHQEFETLCKEVKTLSKSWQGKTANRCIENFDRLKKIEDSRNKVFINYCNILKHTIAEEYELIEDDNISLADYFK